MDGSNYIEIVDVEIHPNFVQELAEWNKGELNSFLIEITRDILAYNDTDGKALVTKIRDSAGQVQSVTVNPELLLTQVVEIIVKISTLYFQKGTGKWTAISALDKGIPVTLIGGLFEIATLD